MPSLDQSTLAYAPQPFGPSYTLLPQPHQYHQPFVPPHWTHVWSRSNFYDLHDGYMRAHAAASGFGALPRLDFTVVGDNVWMPTETLMALGDYAQQQLDLHTGQQQQQHQHHGFG